MVIHPVGVSGNRPLGIKSYDNAYNAKIEKIHIFSIRFVSINDPKNIIEDEIKKFK